MNARELLERSERDLREIRDAIFAANRGRKYWNAELGIPHGWLTDAEDTVAETIKDYGAEMEKVEVPGD